MSSSSSLNQTIALNMIVKNEGAIIIETLTHLLAHIKFDYWVISDTGSTDDTKVKIQTFFDARNIPGKLYQDKWRDFGYNRSLALQYVYNVTDYVFIFDADDSIQAGNMENLLPPLLTFDKYDFKFGEAFTYLRPLLVNNRKKWCYRGVLHEYLSCLDSSHTSIVLDGNYHIVSGRKGFRSKNPNKYLEDAVILENAYKKEMLFPGGDKGLASRYVFYCAQSYKDCNRKEKAIEWYQKVLTHQNWAQEKYYSCLMLQELYKLCGNKEEANKFALKSVEYDGERIDCIASLAQDLRATESHVLVNALYHKFKNYGRYSLENKLFVQKWLYNHVLEYENSISAYYINDKESGYECCKLILMKRKAEYRMRKSALTNLMFYKEEMVKDENIRDLFHAVDLMLEEIYKADETIEPIHCEMWELAFQLSRNGMVTYNHSFVKYLHYKLGKRWDDTELEIAITFTTCRRLDLFKETMNSILNNWVDVDKIDLWFCVDDNSSVADRENMKELYPFVDFYLKNDDEKGHRKSMNLIYDFLKNRPAIKYWIHMEDDFLFHREMNYVSMAKQVLDDKDKNIQQICYNVNYAERVDNYNIRGSEKLLSSSSSSSLSSCIRLHVHNAIQNVGYQNCHYWHHFTFRPSMILTESIMKTGNFDSPNTFFEMDYGKKWFGVHKHQTGFFDMITNRHIGRMTHEKGVTGCAKNAYELNDENQFGETNNNGIENVVMTVSENDNISENDLLLPENNIVCFNETETQQQHPPPPFVKILNLKRRTDRREKMVLLLQKNLGWKEDVEYEFVESVDGKSLSPSVEIEKLFRGNDFSYRKSFIACALSHMKVWEEFVSAERGCGYGGGKEYQIVLEDDIEQIHPAFLQVLEKFDKDGEFAKRDMVYLSNSPCDYGDLKRGFSPTSSFRMQDLCVEKTIGGFFGYSISKRGCMKLLENIKRNGIQHGIDYHVNMKCKEVAKFEIKPQLLFTEYVCDANQNVDSDIQHDYDCFFQTTEIVKKVKMITNWCSSEELCKHYSAMCQFGYRYEDIELVFHNEHDKIDYYVIINRPLDDDEYFVPERTFVFQMEPWVNDASKSWGVKTWGEKWAIPDTSSSSSSSSSFKRVIGRKTSGEHNNVEFNVGLSLAEITNLTYEKKEDAVSSICSSKYFDEGHILRIDFLKYLDIFQKVEMNIFGFDNLHDFSSYKGSLAGNEKYKGMVPFKYYLMVENNFEEGYITEKLWEPMLCECLVFYYGCPNVCEYVDSESFVMLDFSRYSFDECLEIMKRAVEEDWWSLRIGKIKEMKKKILAEMAFFPRLRKMIS